MKYNNNKSHSKKINILGIYVNSNPKEELLNEIQEKITKRMQFYIVTPNPEIILQAQSDSKLKEILNKADFALPDGVGLKLANKNLEIIKGRELMLDLFELANTKKLKIYLLGSKKLVIKKSLEKIKSEYKDIVVKGNNGPILDNKANPVSEVDIKLQFEVFKEINSFKPDLLFLAFGAPKQELFIAKHIKELKITGAIGIGGSLDYYSGFVKPVPKFLENLKLEWLWRLVQEPKRFKRIFNAIIIFPFKLVIDKFSHPMNTEDILK